MLINREHDKINFLEIFDFGKEIYKNLPPVRKRRRRKLAARFIKYFLLIFSAFVIIIFGWNFFVAKNIDPIEQGIAPIETGEIQNDNLTIAFSNSSPSAVQSKVGKSFEYSVDQDINGFFSDLKLNYAYPGPSSKNSPSYQDAVSIYVPNGSVLIRAEGFKNDKVETVRKNGRTLFVGMIAVDQGDIANVEVNYKLPENESGTAKCRKYDLTIKNPKNQQLKTLAINLFFKKDIKDFFPSGFNVFADLNSVKWETDLSQEMEFAVDFN
jgi:hypothetical protein